MSLAVGRRRGGLIFDPKKIEDWLKQVVGGSEIEPLYQIENYQALPPRQSGSKRK